MMVIWTVICLGGLGDLLVEQGWAAKMGRKVGCFLGRLKNVILVQDIVVFSISTLFNVEKTLLFLFHK